MREDNEIHLIEYHEDSNDVMVDRIFPHQYEIWHLAPCPTKADQLFTVYNAAGEYSASLWHAEGLHDDFVTSQTSPLTKILTLGKTADTVRSYECNYLFTDVMNMQCLMGSNSRQRCVLCLYRNIASMGYQSRCKGIVAS